MEGLTVICKGGSKVKTIMDALPCNVVVLGSSLMQASQHLHLSDILF
jgi:hypothetical protein